MEKNKRSREENLIFYGFDPSLIPKDYVEEGRIVAEKNKNLIEKISPNWIVLNGIFAGLRYPSLDISEAALVPKIIGCYESQLHPVITTLLKGAEYDNIINIGSAEGYYAVGMALCMPKSIIHCFDTNMNDMQFLKRMARVNSVKNMTYNKFCDAEVLSNFKFGKKTLILCDCEGYELELFTDKVINFLAKKNVDMLVELHDILNQEISSTLIPLFKKHFFLTIINNQRILQTKWKGLETLEVDERKYATLEHRGGFYQNVYMEWAVVTSKEFSLSD